MDHDENVRFFSWCCTVFSFLFFVDFSHMHGGMERRCMLEIACTIRYAYTVTCLCMEFWHIFSFGYFLAFGFFSVCIRLGFWSIFFSPLLFFLYPPFSFLRLLPQTFSFFSNPSRYIRKIRFCIFFFLLGIYIRDCRPFFLLQIFMSV